MASLTEMLRGDAHKAMDLMETSRRTGAFYKELHDVVMKEQRLQKEFGKKIKQYYKLDGFLNGGK